MKKKLFFATICVMVCMFFCESFTINDQICSRNEMTMSDQCYIVKITYDIVWEYRTDMYDGTTIKTETKKTGASQIFRECASSEFNAIESAKNSCYEVCTNNGKYIKKIGEYYVFEVRRITSAEVTGSCGDC